MVTSSRSWISAISWLSPICAVVRSERDAVGHDGEPYAWCWLLVCEIRDGRLTSMCQFEVDDEDAAFAYAGELARASASRLAISNRASLVTDAVGRALQAHDVDGAVAPYSISLVYDDRRRFGGNPLGDLRAATERILEQYSAFEFRTVAVRGERLHLNWTRWSNDSGFETTYLILIEVDGDGRISYQGAFDEDDFEGAYRELERRYGAGEGAAFAGAVAVTTDGVIALNDGDLDRSAELASPGFVLENRSRGVFPDRPIAEFHASFEGLIGMVASTRQWHRAVCWLSPAWSVGRLEREAVGKDGERYSWSWIAAIEIRAGRFASMCVFEVDDEEAAFAYAEERIRAENVDSAI
jgi:ketosteroid isomerase-like protein